MREQIAEALQKVREACCEFDCRFEHSAGPLALRMGAARISVAVKRLQSIIDDMPNPTILEARERAEGLAKAHGRAEIEAARIHEEWTRACKELEALETEATNAGS